MDSILTHIGVGAENATSRAALAVSLGVSDRKMRKLIEIERRNGALILNAQNGAGYYLATIDDLDDIERQYKQDTARALSILARRRTMRRILKKAGRKV